MLPVVDGMAPEYQTHDVAVFQADCLQLLDELPSDSIDAICTDPPYELGMRPDSRIERWDRTGIAFDHKLWMQIHRVLKPGGHIIAFGSPRTWHRLTVAIEDAGFEIRGSIAWLYGTGFTKSANLEDQLHNISEEAVQKWSGWGVALKPAFEPIVLARKAVHNRVPTAYNLMVHGTGALNLEACKNDTGRIPTNVLIDQAVADEIDGQTKTIRQGGARGTGDPDDDAAVDDAVMRPGQAAKKASAKRFGGQRSSGRTKASDYFPVIKYQPKAPPRERPSVDGVTHPTVKPLDLIKWCIRLITPPRGVVLDPFGGSGTTAQAALEMGFGCITCDSEPEYIPLIVSRLESVLEQWPESVADVQEAEPEIEQEVV